MLVCLLALIVGGIVSMVSDVRHLSEETARLELKYRYSISHHHAGKCSYDTRYYTDVVETEGSLIKFVDQDGKPRLITGDVTVTENGTPRG
ncbi:MAG: hypothetical protein MJZ17_04850 [Bacteroidales bacterium]|nr:hypothetical protein [Bacteroidales bacterium]